MVFFNNLLVKDDGVPAAIFWPAEAVFRLAGAMSGANQKRPAMCVAGLLNLKGRRFLLVLSFLLLLPVYHSDPQQPGAK